MTLADDPTRPPGRSDDELLRRVHQRAAAIRLRRRGGALAVTAVILAVLGIAGLTQIGQDDDRLVRTASGPPTSGSQALATTTTSSPETTPTAAPGPSTTIAASPTTTTPAPTTTVTPCRNSHDPACGPFYFDPPPDPDQPMTVEVIPSVSTVRVGEPMSFHIIRRDADGVSDGLRSYDVGDDSLIAMYGRGLCDRYGPQDPPPKGLTPTVVTDDFPHTYTRAGTFTVKFTYQEGGACQDSRTGGWDRPYASSGEGSVVMTVLP